MQQVRQQIEEIYRTESRHIFATLVRLLGDFDLAEEGLHEAFATAVLQWPTQGIPAHPRSWLVSTGRFKAIDLIRRRSRFDASLADITAHLENSIPVLELQEDAAFADDRLRLIFTCCHPALALSTQVALTLREICGLKTAEIASAFLSTPATIAQRIVRGKTKIRTARIPYEVPTVSDLPERLDAVLSVIYLVFNEGYSVSSGDAVTRSDLSAEAIRLGRLLVELLPATEAVGLLGLMLLQDSRRLARTDANGDLILLEEQDRSLWDQTQIAEGTALVLQALAISPVGIYTIQGAIAAVHGAALQATETNWSQVVALYNVLLQVNPSPVVALNRAVAVAMQDRPLVGLELVETILAQGDLADYHLAYATRADLCRRLGKTAEAKEAYAQALTLVQQEPERRFLVKRLEELG